MMTFCLDVDGELMAKQRSKYRSNRSKKIAVDKPNDTIEETRNFISISRDLDEVDYDQERFISTVYSNSLLYDLDHENIGQHYEDEYFPFVGDDLLPLNDILTFDDNKFSM